MDANLKRNLSDFIRSHRNDIETRNYEKVMEDMPDSFRSSLLPLFRRQGVELLRYTNRLQAGDYDSKARVIYIPDSIQYLATGAFKDFTDLQQVYLSNKIKIISIDCFKNCILLKSIDFPQGLLEIRAGAFYNSGLVSVEMPEELIVIQDGAFKDCKNLEEVYLNDSLIGMGFSAFSGCDKLKYSVIDDCQYLGSKTNPTYCLVKILSEGAVIAKDVSLILKQANNFDVVNYAGSPEDWTFIQKSPGWTTVTTAINYKNS